MKTLINKKILFFLSFFLCSLRPFHHPVDRRRQASSTTRNNNKRYKMTDANEADSQFSPLLVNVPGHNAEENMNEFEMAEKDHYFSTNLCECCGDCKTFWFSFFCPCFQYGRNVNQFGHPPIFDSIDERFNTFVYFFMDWMCCFGIVMTTVLRGDVRDKYGIKGNVVGDFCSSIFCKPCSLAQISREVRANNSKLYKYAYHKYPPAAAK